MAQNEFSGREGDRANSEELSSGDFHAELEARLADAEKQRDEHLASLQRAQADYQNLRRRLQSDIDSAVQRAKGPLLSDLLLVLDYLDMALAAQCSTQEGKNLLAGVDMTKQQLVRALEREGLKAISESGAFDAAVHQAVERVETDERAPNEIVSTLRRGYMLGTTVLRPAQVAVSVAPGKSARGEER
jgi:molecular chaperone GrpE